MSEKRFVPEAIGQATTGAQTPAQSAGCRSAAGAVYAGGTQRARRSDVLDPFRADLPVTEAAHVLFPSCGVHAVPSDSRCSLVLSGSSESGLGSGSGKDEMVTVAHGFGVLSDGRLRLYSGAWREGLREGFGEGAIFEMREPNRGSGGRSVRLPLFVGTFRGEWVAGLRCGFGRLLCPHDGKTVVFVGQWRNDRRNGVGREQLPCGSSDTGYWQDDVKYGVHRFRFFDGDREDHFYDGSGVLITKRVVGSAGPFPLEQTLESLLTAFDDNNSGSAASAAAPAEVERLAELASGPSSQNVPSGPLRLQARQDVRNFVRDAVPKITTQLCSYGNSRTTIEIDTVSFEQASNPLGAVHVLVHDRAFIWEPILKAVREICLDSDGVDVIRSGLGQFRLVCSSNPTDPVEFFYDQPTKVLTIVGGFAEGKGFIDPDKLRDFIAGKVF